MSKYHKIRWRDSDVKELNRSVKNYNAKIKRLIKKNPQIEKYLPHYYDAKTDSFTVNLKTGMLKDVINTRQDLNRELNALKRFSKRGSEELVTLPDTKYNLKTTKWQLKEMNRRKRFIDQRRATRLEEIANTPIKSRGEEVGYTRADIGMGRAEEVPLAPLELYGYKTEQYQFKTRWASVFEQSQSDYFMKSDFRLRDNFLNTLKENYNVSDIADVIESIQNMDIKEFLRRYREDPEAFEWAYPDTEHYWAFVESLKSSWL